MPLAVLCGESTGVLKTFVDKDSEVVLRGIDVVGGIFMAIRTKDGETIFMTSPAESKGKITCLVTAIKQPNLKVEKHFGKLTGGVES